MLGWLDKPITEKSKGPAHEMERLLAFCQDAILPEAPTEAIPVYDPAGLLFAAQLANSRFQELWKAWLGYIVLANVQRKHWATIKAPNRRVALSFDNCEFADLRPVADLRTQLCESIDRFLDKPLKWYGPSDGAQRQTAFNKVRQRVSDALYKFVEDRLLGGPLSEWVQAYEFSGPFSTFSRAGTIKSIVEKATPIPNEAMGREVAAFLNELRALVHSAIIDGRGLLVADDFISATATG